jgi:(R,R)-butanediol dehydrogenase/meso-butanediol dehydrogenase/diacetyl reductase
MRAAVFHGSCDLGSDVPEPEAGPGDVKLRVHYNGICGSDLHEYYAGPMTTRTEPHPLTGVKNPVIFGHELCGSVVALGDGVEDLEIGDRVAVEPVETCGRCLDCRSGLQHCRLLAFHSYNRAGGGLAEYTVVRRSMAHRLHRSLTPAQGALIEPMAIAWATVRRCQVEAGQTVALHGAGPIGIGVSRPARTGVRVIVSDPSPLRRGDRALGAPVVLDPGEATS